MKLMPITILVAKPRDSEGLHTGWNEIEQLWNPTMIRSLQFQEELAVWVVYTPEHDRIPVKGTKEEIQKAFEEAT